MTIVSANINTLIDSDGHAWLDLQSGILNTPFGHGSAVVQTALHEVITSGLINTYDRGSSAQADLIELMNDYMPGYVWRPFNTGGEAIDKAIEVAATYFGRRITIATLPNAFHGKLLSMSAAHYDHLPWGNPLELITINPDSALNSEFDVLIYEPIQGHDGTVNDEKFLRALCDERDALLIADEMITGFMRCGKRMLNETADMIVCGKGISAGVPLSMLGYTPDLLADHNGMIPVGWRSTGAGNNLAMVVGRTSLEMMIHTESAIKEIVDTIEEKLRSLGFAATGALGFKELKNQEATKSYFEDQRIVASWHNPPQMRVGPSFMTTNKELAVLGAALEQVDEL